MTPEESLFPPRPAARPMIYAYEEDNPEFSGLLKVGFASAYEGLARQP